MNDVQLPRPGEMVAGKYRIESIVGTGGMGVVMGATDQSLGRPVAIKFLSPQKLAREGARERFMREARAAAQIQSENVVRVYEVGTTESGAPFIVMEQLRGADLAQVLQGRGGLGIDEAVDFVLQACEALGEAHARGIVHRDLKPQNLFLTQRPDGSPCVKVLDFGISKAMDEQQPNLTSTDMVMGTPLYMSPEQVRSLKNVDHRSDIWALGSILFELLTASPVFDAPSMSALCAMIATDPPVPLRARRPQAPPELEQVILRCLHKDPNGRYQDVAALAEALMPFASPRGRDSAMRISRVVRGGPGLVALAGSVPPGPAAEQLVTMGTTVSAAARPSFGPPMQGSQGPPPTTQQTWQQQPTGPMPMQVPPKKSGGGVFIALGLVAGLVVIAGGGGGYAYWRAKHLDASSIPSATPASSASSSPTPATTTSAATSNTSAHTATKDAGAPAHDAGAPNVAKDAGAGSDKDKAEKERIAALAAHNREQCNVYQQDMTTFARTDEQRKKAAERAKMFTCRGQVSTSCERQVCMQACGILGDGNCLRDMQYVIDHGMAPPY